MYSKYLKWTAVMALLVAGAVAFAIGQMPARGMDTPEMGMHRHFMGFVAKQLQLTDAQKTQIKSMWQAEKPTMQPLLQQLATGRKQMLALTANGNFDAGKVSALANQQSQTIAQLMVERQKLIAQVYNRVLTPDQRSKADQIRANHEQRIDQWLQRMNEQSPAKE